MEEQTKNTVIFYSSLFFMSLSILCLGLISGAYFTIEHQNSIKSLIYEKPKDLILINNITLDQEVNILYERIKPIFKYNISNVGVKMTDEQLIKEGGVCLHWADWYVIQAHKDGFDAVVQVLTLSNTTAHAYAVVTTSHEYCILDQDIQPYCGRLK